MVNSKMVRRRISGRRIRARPHKFTSSKRVLGRGVFANSCPKVIEKEWEGAICSVCMECPHNAVLLLCSSHEKGCRPYMCGTSFRYSNCLAQYKKASTKLKCPFSRGQVKGWTIVQPARDDLNLKERSCTQENCSFAGAFKELRKHMKMDHPCARQREVDSDAEQKWRRLEVEQDRGDVISTIRSTMPGTMVFGDYVLESGPFGSDDDDDEERDEEGRIDDGLGRSIVNVFLMLQAFGSSDMGAIASETSRDLASDANDLEINQRDADSSEREEDSLTNQVRSQRRVVLGSSVSRRRRNREANENSGHSR